MNSFLRKDLLINYLMISLLILSEIIYLAFYAHFTHPIKTFTAVSIFNSIIFIGICILIRRYDYNRKVVYIFFAAGIIFRLTLLPVYPSASDDIYRYVWDGKVQSGGINPYRFAPEDSALVHLHSNVLPALINHPQMKTIYPPYSQYVFMLSYKLFGETVYGIKILLFIFEVVTLLLLFLLLKKLKIPGKNLALYSLCPLPIMQFMIDGHIDAAGFPLLLLIILLFTLNKQLSSSIFLGLSIASKFITGMILPFLFQETKGWKKILILTIPFAVLGFTYIPYLSTGVFPFEALFQFTTHWIANSSVFTIIYEIMKDNQDARQVCAILFVLSGVVLFFLRMEWYKKIYFIFFLFLIFSPTVHPWYVTWLAVLLPICFKWSGAIFVATVNLANIPLINYVVKGIWETSYSILLIEYVPVFIFFIYEVYFSYQREKETRRLSEV